MLDITTMSDLGYLPQVLTLHRSLQAHGQGSTMTIICMDDASRDFLHARRLRGVELLELPELERADPALAATRPGRTWSEYCWTVTTALCVQRLRRARSGTVVAWVDADVEFVRPPDLLVDALEGASVLLTPHRYNRAHPTAALASELTALYGTFNGGTIAFRRDEQGMAAAELWRQRTLAWCAEECEPGRFGNQLHLEDFPQRFDRARVLPVPGGILGPWNGGRFRVRAAPSGALADGRPVIAYHYQSLRLRRARPRAAQVLTPNVFPLRQLGLEAQVRTHYRLSRRERRHLWRPYVARLGTAVGEVLHTLPEFADTIAPVPDAAAARATAREGLSLNARRMLPVWWVLRAHLIAVASLNLASALRRRGRRPRLRRRGRRRARRRWRRS